jgi:undecaprenyl-diphosphatase
MFLVTGVMLVLLGRLRPRDGSYRSLDWKNALVIGCFQAVAILPGISRSGSTILGGRLMGLRNEDSVTFSFLLAIPAILGATTLELIDWLRQPTEASLSGPPALQLWLGAGIAFAVGVFALLWLIGWSRLDRLHWFACWCFPVGLWTIGHFSGWF